MSRMSMRTAPGAQMRKLGRREDTQLPPRNAAGGRAGFWPQVPAPAPRPSPRKAAALPHCPSPAFPDFRAVPSARPLACQAFVGQRPVLAARHERPVLRRVIGLLSGASSRDRQQILCLLYGQHERYLISDEPRVLFCVITVQSSPAQSCPVHVIS